MTRKVISTDGFVTPAAQQQPRPRRPALPRRQAPTRPRTTATSSLPSIDPSDIIEPKPKRERRKWNKRKIIKITAIILAVIVLAVAGYFVYKLVSTSNKVFSGNPLDLLNQGKPLKTDEYGRSNILLFGTSEDDPGHPGAELADSIMVASVDQEKNEAFLVSIPRDLEVDYGRACISGYRGKVNVVYQCAKEDAGLDEAGAQTEMRKTVGEVLGLDVQYSVHVNYTALKQMVDAVGGITVTIESDDPRGIYERYVKLPNGPANLNGEAALALARARNAEGGYGLSRSNFDREQYQQKILVALRDKAASVGTLANPVAINSLLEAVGNNVRTNFDTSEIKTLAKIAENTPSDKITRLDLNASDNMILDGTGNPSAGKFIFDDLQAFIRAYASGDTYLLENAVIAVLNGSETAGAAQLKADELAEETIDVTEIGNAPDGFAANGVQLYDQSGGQMPGTLEKLEKTLGVKAGPLPAEIVSHADFVIVVGAAESAEE